MLLLGKSLGWDKELVEPRGDQTFSPFVSITLHVLDGRESRRVRIGKDFPESDLPAEDERCALDVSVSAYRNGGGINVTALSRDREVEKRLFGPAVVTQSAPRTADSKTA